MEPAPTPSSVKEWLRAWESENFSWKALAKKPSWRSSGEDLQTMLRNVTSRNATDDQLQAQLELIPCGRRGLYHLLFIPPEWASKIKGFPLTKEKLEEKQTAIWGRIQGNLIREHSSFLVSGVQLPPSVAANLVTGTRVSFAWTRFRDQLQSIAKRPEREFSRCLFEGPILMNERLNETVEPTVKFVACHFSDAFSIIDLGGVRRLEFDQCVFAGKVTLETGCSAALQFDYCNFFVLDGDNCVFKRKFELYECELEMRCEFMYCSFTESIAFVSVTFNHSVVLTDCDFNCRATFVENTWPDLSDDIACCEGSKFFSTVSFAGSQSIPIQFFNNAEFLSAVTFGGGAASVTKRAVLSELLAKQKPAGKSGLYPYAQEIEGGARVLRKLAETRGDIHQEHFWHRAEIIARRHRGDTGTMERLFSRTYGLVADYGISIGRPFNALFISVMAFAILYGWLGGPAWVGSIDVKSMEEGFGYSLSRTIPIGVFSDEANFWRKALLGSGGELSSIAIRTIATTQSIISAVLIYLGVMAIRRKFRIA